jgi:hypothetical protein
MIKLGEIDNFEALEKVAEETERTKQMKMKKLTDTEKDAIANWISDCTGGLKGAHKLTGLSCSYLSALKNKHRNTIRHGTYEIFKHIIVPDDASLDEKLEELKESEKPKEEVPDKTIIKKDEFQVMSDIGEALSHLDEKEDKLRVLDYWYIKLGHTKSDDVFVINKSGIHKLERN